MGLVRVVAVVRYQRVHRDAAHAEIVRALRDVGCSVLDLAGVGGLVPDLLVARNGVNTLMEIKTPGSQRDRWPRKREAAQAEWREGWRGPCVLVRTVDEALRAAGVAAP